MPSTSPRIEDFYLLKMSATVLETRTTYFKKEPYFLIDQSRTCCILMLYCIKSTAWKVTKYRVFSGPYFPVFGLNTERYLISSYLSVFSPNAGKYGPERTPYLDTSRSGLYFNPICLEGGGIFFDRCILTGRALKLILCEFSSNSILNMWPVKFFSSVK